MSIIGIIVVLIVVGVLLWLVNSFIPMESRIKQILNVVVIILIVLWLLSLFVDFGNIGNVHVGKIKL